MVLFGVNNYFILTLNNVIKKQTKGLIVIVHILSSYIPIPSYASYLIFN